MKHIYLLILAGLLTFNVNAQAPESFKYQAVVRDGSGNVLANQSVGVQIKILQSSSTGTAVYTETFTPTSNNFGLINLEIGTGFTTDDFSTILWEFASYFIEVGVDPAGGTTYSITGVSQLLSVPYALHAKSAQWTNAANGNGIHYFPTDLKNVAINDNPSIFSKLLVSIDDPDTGLGNIRAFNYDSDGSSTIMVSNDNANNFVMGVGGSTYAFGANEAFLWYFADFDLKIATGGTERLRIKNSASGGNIEVKTGDVYIENIGSGVITKSPDGNCWRMTVSNAGAPIFTAITCP